MEHTELPAGKKICMLRKGWRQNERSWLAPELASVGRAEGMAETRE